jgi:hypothetical protein
MFVAQRFRLRYRLGVWYWMHAWLCRRQSGRTYWLKPVGTGSSLIQ